MLSKGIAIAIVAGLLFMTGCGTCSRPLKPTSGTAFISPGTPGYDSSILQMQYLGAGGFLMRRGNDVILTAPFYSNPNIFRTGLLFPIHSKTNEIKQLLPDVRDVTAILAGHSHYDHLMDLPYIANHRAPNATIYGNNTMRNILCAEIDSCRLVGLDSRAGSFTPNGAAGEWITNGMVRFMPLKSEHSPHFLEFKFYTGEVKKPRTCLPCTALGWKEGQTLAFLIDFLGPNGRIDYRISYHDAAMDGDDYGGMPQLPETDRKSPDITILCMGASGTVDDYPEGIVTNPVPKHVVVGHWENFFKSQSKQTNCFEVVPFTSGKKFMRKLAAVFPREKTILPNPGGWMHFTTSVD